MIVAVVDPGVDPGVDPTVPDPAKQKLGRFLCGLQADPEGRRPCSPEAGWQHLHVAIDYHTRLAYSELLPSERKED
jgi:hypothetical protein